MIKKYAGFILALATAFCTHSVFADTWLDRPIRMVVPYPPGGATDFSARVYSEQIGKILGKPVVVENRAGAAGEIGAQLVAASAPDGYTVLMGALGSLAINSLLPSKQQQYQFPDAFDGVSMATSTPLAVVVRAGLPVNNIKELIELARENPGTLTYGSAGYGSSQHMTGEKFQQVTGIELLHVPYRGSGPALNDLLGGQVDIVFDTMPTLMGHAGNENIRFLAVTTAERAASLPDIPTLQEEGVTDFDVSTRYVLVAPKGTPVHILERLSGAMQQAAEQAGVQAAMKSQGADALTMTPAATYAALGDEVAIWKDVAAAAKLE